MRRRTHYLSPKLRKEPFPEKAGYGVVATTAIRQGELLVVWGGRIVNRTAVDEMNDKERAYVLQVEDGLYLVASRPLEIAEYINHSCEPNAGFSGQIALVALQDIAPGEEVCFDYGMSESSDFAEFDCRCGAAECRGRVRASDWSLPALQHRYRGYFSPYLQRRIEAAASLAVASVGRARARTVKLPEPAPAEAGREAGISAFGPQEETVLPGV